jgi:hypothetical protein
MFTEEQLLPLSALQHWLFCPRQCGLIHLEQVWAENKFTAEGQVLHKKAHEGPDESKAGVRITRSLSVRSFALGISGQCDIVEFHGAFRNLISQFSDLRGRASGTADELHEGDFKSQIFRPPHGGRGLKLIERGPAVGNEGLLIPLHPAGNRGISHQNRTHRSVGRRCGNR